jgi:UDP-N-acetyl-D-glucosamine dehydrogenase
MDCVTILTDHSTFDYSMVAKFSPVVLDTRNALKGFSRPDLCPL